VVRRRGRGGLRRRGEEHRGRAVRGTAGRTRSAEGERAEGEAYMFLQYEIVARETRILLFTSLSAATVCLFRSSLFFYLL
jgi:hypothetical protein